MVSALVVLATHNPRIDLLDAQLDSLRAQTVTDWRCLVFDDSSANTDAIAAHVNGLVAAGTWSPRVERVPFYTEPVLR